GTRTIEVRNYIDGGWRDPSGTSFESRDPATGGLVATARVSTTHGRPPAAGRRAGAARVSPTADLSAAVDAARRTFDTTDWPTTAGKARSAILYELARLLRAESGR